MTDLKTLIPDIDKIDIKDRKTGKAFNLDLFLNKAAGLIVMEHLDLFRKAAQGKIDPEIVPFVDKMLECMFKPQYKFMDAAWCNYNVDLPTTLKIIMVILKDVLEFLKILGIGAMPQKKPEADGNDQAIIT